VTEFGDVGWLGNGFPAGRRLGTGGKSGGLEFQRTPAFSGPLTMVSSWAGRYR